MNVRALAGIGLAATFALTACGSSSAATLTKADWVTQANAICKDLNDRAAAITPKTQAELGPAITKIAQISAEDIGKIKALKPPAEIQSDVTSLLDAYGKANDAFQAAAAKVASGDISGATTHLSTAADAGKAGDPIATRLGATDCTKQN